jgi:hypothetical protein
MKISKTKPIRDLLNITFPEYKGRSNKRQREIRATPCGRAFLVENGYARRPRKKVKKTLAIFPSTNYTIVERGEGGR